MRDRLAKLGLKPTLVAKNIGYEVRCADPIPFDMEYTRDLGYCGAKFLIEGGSGALISIQQGRFKPVPFDEIMDPQTGRMRIRLVDVASDRYRIAYAYMLRLKRVDFEDPARAREARRRGEPSPRPVPRRSSAYLVDEQAPALDAAGALHFLNSRPNRPAALVAGLRRRRARSLLALGGACRASCAGAPRARRRCCAG